MDAGKTLLPLNRTELTKALEGLAAFSLNRVDIDLVKQMRDPYRCSVSHLPFLAWGRGVDLWRDSWPDWKKRKITDEIYGMKGLKGTLPGINKYLSYVDATVYDAVIPPVGAFAIKYSREALEAWRSQFAELRLYPYSIPGDRPTFAAGTDTRLAPSFAGMTFAQENNASRYYGRRATIVDHGVETEIRSFEQMGSWGSDAAIDVTTFAIPADGTLADTIANYAYVGHSFASAGNRGRLITIGRDGTFGAGDVPAGVESVTPLNIAPERIYQRHDARYMESFARNHGASAANLSFVYSDASAQYIYDRWRLLDPDRMDMQSTGFLAPFVGHTYVGLTPYTALLRVKATYQRDGWSCFAGHSFVGKTHVGAETERIKDVGEAIYKSRSLRDQIWFTTATYRPKEIKDLSFTASHDWSGMIPMERISI